MLQGDGPLLFPNLLAVPIEIGGLNTTDLAKFEISLFSGNYRLVRALAYAIGLGFQRVLRHRRTVGTVCTGVVELQTIEKETPIKY